MFKRILKPVGRVVLVVLGVPLMYVVLAFLFGLLPANRNSVQPAEGIQIYIISNGVHTDIALPIQTPGVNWAPLFPAVHFKDIQPAQMTHIAFGWGDQGFYLETPTWDDLKASTAMRALFLKSPTAMHVTYYRNPRTSEWVRPLMISPEQYTQLIGFIKDSFAQDAAGNPVLIPGKGYRNNDTFYAANGSYSLFNTCNDWTGRALRKAGIKTGIWTPFSQSIMHHLKNEEGQKERTKPVVVNKLL